jgi:hypothetical protein
MRLEHTNMWENWEKEVISDKEIYYTLPLHLEIEETEMVIELTVMLLQNSGNHGRWKVSITAHHRSSGEYIGFEGTFQSFEEAEKKAWDRAQEAINIRKKWLSQNT